MNWKTKEKREKLKNLGVVGVVNFGILFVVSPYGLIPSAVGTAVFSVLWIMRKR